MTEDEIFRTTTQYRLWSYTQETLASLRLSTNLRAAARVREAIQRVQLQNETSIVQPKENGQKQHAKQVDCLNVEEEQKLVGFYCVKALEFSDFCEFPTNVKVSLAQA